MNVLPAIVNVPLRGDVALFAAILNPTVPLPVPGAPLVTVSHGALLNAVHAHAAATSAEPVAEPEPTLSESTDNVAEQLVVKANVFETELCEEPPGPSAETRLS